jgi:acyl-CoA synthetase (AMP-forming)/AMP-acid ligase II
MALEIAAGEGASFGALLDDAATHYGARTAYDVDGRTMTFDTVAELSRRVARELADRGFSAGDRLALWSSATLDYIVVVMAAARLRVGVVPISTRYKSEDAGHALDAADPKALLFGRDARGSFPLQALAEGLLVDEIEGVVAAAEARESAELEELEEMESDDFIAQYQFTSGTTGRPKLVELRSSAVMRSAQLILRERLGMRETDRFFSPAPFYHAGGSVLVLLAPLMTGCSVHVQSRFAAGEALAIMDQIGATITLGHQPHFADYMAIGAPAPASLRGAMVIANPEFNRRVEQYLAGAWVVSPYGLTETTVGGTCARWDDPPDVRLSTVGSALTGLEVEIDRSHGNDGIGEVMVRGWAVSPGYFGIGPVTDRNGWYRTGDLGHLDENRNLQLLGRVKEIVRVGGENVSPVEVENVLMRHPDVVQAVVVGRPHERLGEVCVAAVELRPGAAASAEQIVGFCAPLLASFKVPRSVAVVSEWPRTSSGKIARAEIQSALEHPEQQLST